jgi:hypothetical protein
MARLGRKQRLYDLGKNALGRWAGQAVPGYVCPLCLRDFDQMDNLTEEHVPPKAIGGKVLCLTCRECNSSAGHSAEAHVNREKLSRAFFAAGGPVRRAKLTVEGIQANVGLRRGEKGIQMHVLGPENDPTVVEALQSALRGMQSGGTLELRDSISYSRPRADVAYLKAAYLAAFAWLGYAYILRSALDRVRQQIHDPGCRALEAVRVYDADFGATGRAFFLLEKPISCLAAKIADSVVCLPLPDGNDLFYEQLAASRASGGKLTCQGRGPIPWPDKFELALDLGPCRSPNED